MRGARSAVGLNQNETGVYWNLGAFRPLPTGVSHSPCDFYIHNFYTVQLDPNVNQRFRGLMLFNTHLLLGEPGAVVCTTFDAVLSSLQCIGTTTLASNYCNMVECDVSLGSQSGAGAGFTLGSTNLDMIGCKLFCRSSSGTHTLTLPTSYTLDVYVPSAGGQNRNGDTPTSNLFINVPASSRGSIRCIDRGMSGHYKVTTTGAPARLELDGDFDDINVAHSVDELVADVVCDQFTCVVPAAGMSPHKLKIQARGTVDITGPAVIDVTLQRTPICFLRGGRISGHISLGASVAQPAPAGTRLQFIGADDCNVDVSGHASGAPAGHQPWWLDGNSDRNILDFAGASTFPTAGTNDGVGNLVRTT